MFSCNTLLPSIDACRILFGLVVFGKTTLGYVEPSHCQRLPLKSTGNSLPYAEVKGVGYFYHGELVFQHGFVLFVEPPRPRVIWPSPRQELTTFMTISTRTKSH